MLLVGMNPYGIAYTVGLQGRGTPRANPDPIGLEGFVRLAEEAGAKSIEIPADMLTPLSPKEMARLADRLSAGGKRVVISHPLELDADGVQNARTLGARVIRMCLTRVLCGDRAAIYGAEWPDVLANARRTLKLSALLAADNDLTLAIENHQDLTSTELMDFAAAAGENVGICMDIGNALAVGESPLSFARTVAPRIRHVHIKDYRAQRTDEGYRLVRCAIGDGAVPLREVFDILMEGRSDLTASIEVGALHARHVRLLTDAWWHGYDPSQKRGLDEALAAARVNELEPDEEWRTPWERECPVAEIVGYEMDMMYRSVTNLTLQGIV